jgi:hypothetical protein
VDRDVYVKGDDDYVWYKGYEKGGYVYRAQILLRRPRMHVLE